MKKIAKRLFFWYDNWNNLTKINMFFSNRLVFQNAAPSGGPGNRENFSSRECLVQFAESFAEAPDFISEYGVEGLESLNEAVQSLAPMLDNILPGEISDRSYFGGGTDYESSHSYARFYEDEDYGIRIEYQEFAHGESGEGGLGMTHYWRVEIANSDLSEITTLYITKSAACGDFDHYGKIQLDAYVFHPYSNIHRNADTSPITKEAVEKVVELVQKEVEHPRVMRVVDPDGEVSKNGGLNVRNMPLGYVSEVPGSRSRRESQLPVGNYVRILDVDTDHETGAEWALIIPEEYGDDQKRSQEYLREHGRSSWVVISNNGKTYLETVEE